MKKKGIGYAIFSLRQENGLSQKLLGEKLGYNQRTISNWESERSEPNIDAIRKLA